MKKLIKYVILKRKSFIFTKIKIMKRRIHKWVLTFAVFQIFCTGTITATTPQECFFDIVPSLNLRETDQEESLHHPFGVTREQHFEPPKCELYIALESVFKTDRETLAACKKIPTSTLAMQKLEHDFFQMPRSATAPELQLLHIDTFIYLREFCSGYQSIVDWFRKTITKIEFKKILHEIDTTQVTLMLSNFEETNKLTASAKQALENVTSCKQIKEILIFRVVNYCRTSDFNEGAKAAFEELAKPSLFYSDATGFVWNPQLFLLRLQNLKLLKQLLVKANPSNKSEVYETTVTVKKTIGTKSWLGCFGTCDHKEE